MAKTLIADDLKKWHDVAERNLSYFGFREFLHAYDIREGLLLYEAHKPALVLTDINFDVSDAANLDGLVLCSEIRNKDKNAKIAVMSSRMDAKEAAMASGADYFVQKPQFMEQIEEFIKLHCGEAR